MNREKSEKKEILQNRNLGALNVRDFGVENDQQCRYKESVSDKLKRERAKAEDFLKHSRRDYFDAKENEQSYDTTDLNYSDYEPYRVPKPISNISDLFVDTTINLGNFTNMPTDTKAPKISFKPSGCSTYLHRDQLKDRKSTIDRISVNDIFSSSGSQKVQNLGRLLSSISSINYNGLPRTADMSSNISKNDKGSFGAVANSFGKNINFSGISSKNIAPDELMGSKLIEGEISWAQQYAALSTKVLSKDAKERAQLDGGINVESTWAQKYAAIPTKVLSKDAKERAQLDGGINVESTWAQKYAAIPTKVLSKDAKEIAQLDGGINAEFFDSTYHPNLLMCGDSIGQYFNERVENISNILPNKYPVRSFTSRALIDNTISKPEGSPKKIKSHESKDSGHASDNSNMLSLSGIDRALAQLDVDDSPTYDANKFMELAKIPRFHYTRCDTPFMARNRTPLSSPIKDPSPRGSCLSLGNVYKNDEKFVEVYRSTSPYSTSSVFSHRDGKIIPIKVTALSLSWGCTKLRIAALKSIQVKNTFNKRLVLRAEIHGSGFQIVSTQNSSAITLQSQECRTFMISFCPAVTGEAIGVFILCSPNSASSNNATYVRIPLYGYGGHASIKIIEAFRAPDNTFFLPMGNVIELPRPLEQSFKLHNKGPLLGFAIISADSGSFNSQREIDSFTIEPNHVLIKPDSSVNIRVTFKPKREYLSKILKKAHSVQVLGYLCVFSGAEVNRQRLHRIVRNIPSEERSEKLGLAAIPELNSLWDVFPEEIKFSELEALKDDRNSANEFITTFVVNEIALTLNCDDLSDTVVSSSPSCRDVDETVIFRSKQVEENLHEKSNASEEEGAVSSTQEVNWSVYPDFINFVMKSECHSFVIVNSYKSRKYFEASCNAKNLLILKPNEGYIDADGGGTMINVTLVKKELPVVLPKGGVMITVYTENGRKTIPVTFSNNKH